MLLMPLASLKAGATACRHAALLWSTWRRARRVRHLQPLLLLLFTGQQYPRDRVLGLARYQGGGGRPRMLRSARAPGSTSRDSAMQDAADSVPFNEWLAFLQRFLLPSPQNPADRRPLGGAAKLTRMNRQHFCTHSLTYTQLPLKCGVSI